MAWRSSQLSSEVLCDSHGDCEEHLRSVTSSSQSASQLESPGVVSRSITDHNWYHHNMALLCTFPLLWTLCELYEIGCIDVVCLSSTPVRVVDMPHSRRKLYPLPCSLSFHLVHSCARCTSFSMYPTPHRHPGALMHLVCFKLHSKWTRHPGAAKETPS